MEILLWLVPPAVATALAMAWVSWLGREGRGEVDREVALRRLGAALEGNGRWRRRRSTPGYAVVRSAPADRSTGIAVRPSAAAASRASVARATQEPGAPAKATASPTSPDQDRRAS